MVEYTRTDLLGDWRLLDWRRVDGDQASYPYGPEAEGRICYSGSGWMYAFLMDPAWRAAAQPPSKPMFLSYSGPFEITDGVVHHDVVYASDARLLGQVLRRRLDVHEDGAITLETLASVGRDDRDIHHLLRWRRG